MFDKILITTKKMLDHYRYESCILLDKYILATSGRLAQRDRLKSQASQHLSKGMEEVITKVILVGRGRGGGGLVSKAPLLMKENVTVNLIFKVPIAPRFYLSNALC